jgi:cytochrome oxidase Cu insertion factor (SCO1/SenC/PrrC family)
MARLSRWLPVALAIALAGCAFSGKPDTAPAVNQSAPDVTGVDQDGKAFKLSDYRGKVVMLDFWFST